ncbi:tol-pal system protein YbgF [Bacterioplanes sanyensis]|uniref:Cell division coordinator CpoB n=1 Tax=Bacterioplanes sanyensis TaxID=1249553 RepID=A0A222FML3_9GAMM|nr:tol-pal system protein YbgF [Bacterioplanes sanyensis]ASP39463.1 tol-pal system protein YbgF [Bacterioplanes sanyensis]
MAAKYLLLSAALASSSAWANEWVSVGEQVPTAPVAKPVQANQPVTASAPQASNQSDLLTELLMQVEQMQQEIAYLRSQVETQQRQMSALQQSSQQRYLDLDRRVSSLMQQPVEALAPVPSVSSSPSSPATVAPTVSAAEAYKQAMALVRDKQFAQAREAFAAFTTQYPNDELVANAWYWAGEVALVQGEQQAALDLFKQVIDKHPQHGKAADASYKYAVTLHKLGRTDEAKQWLQRVISTYAGKAEATVQLARSYLNTL